MLTKAALLAVRHGKMQSFNAASGHLDTLAFFVYMAVVSSLASAAVSRQHDRRAKKQEGKHSLKPSWWSLRSGDMHRDKNIVWPETCTITARLPLSCQAFPDKV